MKLALNKIKDSTLYVVSTPIGNLADITFRAIDILKSVDFIAVESVKNSQKLLMKFNIKTKLLKVNKFNENYSSENVLEILSKRKSVAIITDAGTPSISDPGGTFVNNILNGGYKVVPIPGACSLTCALSVCGLSYSQFIFHGFLESKKGAKSNYLLEYSRRVETHVFFEAPHRLIDTLILLGKIFGDERKCIVLKEMTKIYENIFRGTFHELITKFNSEKDIIKGEFVIVVEGTKEIVENLSNSESILLKELMEYVSLKKSVNLISTISKAKKKLIYEKALELKKK